VVVLVSGEGTLLQALIEAAAQPATGFAVCGVLTDRPQAGGLQRALVSGVPTAVVQPADFPDRATWDLAVARAVEAFKPDVVVLAGFMRILGPAYLERLGKRTINTHPALLPAFPGSHGVRDALAYRVKVTGCSVILVDAGADSGPVIAQQCVPVLDDDTEPVLHERIKVAERALLVQVVDRMTAHGWSVDGRLVRLNPAEPAEPVDPADPAEDAVQAEHAERDAPA
jgi:phosphoribosylglycinamide formyltransferase 1